jgi:hypothetical protein
MPRRHQSFATITESHGGEGKGQSRKESSPFKIVGQGSDPKIKEVPVISVSEESWNRRIAGGQRIAGETDKAISDTT